MKLLVGVVGGCAVWALGAMYFLGAIALIITSLGNAAFYWHAWWMCPVQAFVGLFMIAIGIEAVGRWLER